MKRSPLNRKTPLKPGNKPMKRSRLKARSKKVEKLYKEERIPLVVKTLEERPICECCHSQQSTEVHEKLTRGRSGGVHGDAWLDPANLLALCHWCHSWITRNPEEAEAKGYMLQSEN